MNPTALPHHAATDCPNCGAAVSGNYCHGCGQETLLHPPSTREFVHEFIGHYVALEGKLWKSLGLLLFRPGRLTLEYLHGRRVRYVQPLRLYLTLSLLFFAVMKYGGHDVIHVGQGRSHPAPAAATASGPAAATPAPAAATVPAPPSAPARATAGPAQTAELIHEDRPGEIREGTHALRRFVGRYSPHAAGKLAQFSDLPPDGRQAMMSAAFYGYVPYAIFFMMPLFALYLKVLYLGSGRRYGEHLLFALHVNGFAFVAMTLIMLVPEGLGPGLGLAEWLLWLWLAFYLPAAMRRVYGGSRTATALRWIVLAVLHLLTLLVAIFAAVAFGMLH